jgi:hypothetical protein
MLADQQGGKAAAIDEEICGELLPRLHVQVRDVPALIGLHAHDFVVNVAHTELLDAMLLQEGREFSSIQMVRIVGEAGVLRSADELRCQPRLTQRRLET